MGSNANCERKSAARGQTIMTASGRDDSSYGGKGKESFVGGKMGGSTTNLGHTLKGASAVQNASGKGSK